ncbi:MAG: MBL fold metallo-hydrolase [Nitrospirae bacterium]|nr:MBL fold metallo-hydrolase [Nitrospirota bacterium]
MGYLFCIIASIILIVAAPLSSSAETGIKKVTNSVYAYLGYMDEITKSNEGFISNCGFIVTDEGVVVVDTQLTPDLGRKLLSEIRKVTNKPVKYVINTHFHPDHFFGNQVFKDTAVIISHENTRTHILDRGEFAIKTFRERLGELFDDAEVVLPMVTFNNKLTIHLGGRKIEISYFGRGHTDGDAIVYVPDEKVVFAGDLVNNGRLPFIGDGHSGDLVETLKKMDALDVNLVIPGHGYVSDKTGIAKSREFIEDLRAEVKKYIENGKSLQQTINEIKMPKYNELGRHDLLPRNAKKVYLEFEDEILFK